MSQGSQNTVIKPRDAFGSVTNEAVHAQMLAMIAGKWIAQALYVVAELGIPDLLAEGPRTTTQLAAATGAHSDSLYRVLRALSSVSVFIEGPQRDFRNTELGATLRRDVPGSLSAPARFEGMPSAWKAWGEFLHSVRTGECGFERAVGEPIYTYFSQHPDEAGVLNATMTSISEGESQAVVDAYDFSDARSVVDVGGGHGHLLAAILAHHPALTGILLEMPHAVEGARQLLTGSKLTERAAVLAGDAFESVVGGKDIYILKRVIHNWDDDRVLRLLRNCAGAMTARSKLLVIEILIGPANTPEFSKLMDLEMLAMTDGGRERTEAEYQALFAASGLKLRRVYPSASSVSLLETVITGSL
jgi:hypothetical protein